MIGQGEVDMAGVIEDLMVVHLIMPQQETIEGKDFLLNNTL